MGMGYDPQFGPNPDWEHYDEKLADAELHREAEEARQRGNRHWAIRWVGQIVDRFTQRKSS